jgi:hypothetical protein
MWFYSRGWNILGPKAARVAACGDWVSVNPHQGTAAFLATSKPINQRLSTPGNTKHRVVTRARAQRRLTGGNLRQRCCELRDFFSLRVVAHSHSWRQTESQGLQSASKVCLILGGVPTKESGCTFTLVYDVDF